MRRTPSSRGCASRPGSPPMPQSSVCAYPWQQMNIDLTGEVVPCCFWSGYGNGGKPLGNTNVQSLEEIWNGEAYRALRRENAEGLQPGHPCHECLAWQWGRGTYPKFELPSELRREQGHAWIVPLPESARALLARTAAPDAGPALAHAHDAGSANHAPDAPAVVPVARLLEDGRELGPGDALHDDIRQHGAGRFSLWDGWLYLSTSDNSDPLRNGRRYELALGEHLIVLSALSPDTTSGRNVLQARDEHERGVEVMTAKPTMISFISTSDCNIDCPACSQNTVRRTKVQHRPGTEADVLAHVPYLTQFIWHGGEPYLIRGFRQFVDGFRSDDNPNLAFGFTSNGTLLNAAELSKLEKFPRINASVSMDSFDKASFETIRKGARFDSVCANVLRAVKWSDPPRRVVSVGMVVLKSNIHELPQNLSFAVEHDIGLNLSPVVVYPVTEQLDVFEDFAAQTRGWDAAIESALDVVRRAKSEGRPAMRRVDPEGMLGALRGILDEGRRRYAETFDVRFLLADPHKSLARMRRPGLIARVGGRAIAYAEVSPGPSPRQVLLRLPRTDLGGDVGVAWSLCHDMLEPMGAVETDELRDPEGCMLTARSWTKVPQEVFVEIPRFAPVPLPRNASVSHRGLPTPDGLVITDPQQVFDAYQAIVAREAARKKGVLPDPGPSWIRRLRRLPEPSRPQRYRDFADLRVEG